MMHSVGGSNLPMGGNLHIDPSNRAVADKAAAQPAMCALSSVLSRRLEKNHSYTPEQLNSCCQTDANMYALTNDHGVEQLVVTDSLKLCSITAVSTYTA
jgi:hypothetical protein